MIRRIEAEMKSCVPMSFFDALLMCMSKPRTPLLVEPIDKHTLDIEIKLNVEREESTSETDDTTF